MPSFQPVAVPRLYRVIASQIKDTIAAGDFPPGARLPSERELSELFEVSRPSVREALIALEIEGWVDVRVGSGVYVTGQELHAQAKGPQRHDRLAPTVTLDIGANDLLQARLLVEPSCAELAARYATTDQLDTLETLILSVPGAERPGLQDDQLHLFIAQICGNAALAATVQHLCSLSERSAIVNKLNHHFVHDDVWELAHEEHLRVLNALQKRKPAAASEAMRNHLLAVCARLGLNTRDDQTVWPIF